MRVTVDQLRQFQDVADELSRFSQIEDHVGMPPVYYLHLLEKALPDLAARIRALATQIAAQPDEPEARF